MQWATRPDTDSEHGYTDWGSLHPCIRVPNPCQADHRIPNGAASRYAAGMRKTTLEFDEELFERAREVLGTRGLKATVQRAFQEVLAMDARRRAIQQLLEMDGLDLDRPEVMAEAWR